MMSAAPSATRQVKGSPSSIMDSASVTRMLPLSTSETKRHRAVLHRAVGAHPRERGGERGEREQGDRLSARGSQCRHVCSRAAPDEKIREHEDADEDGAHREAEIGAEVFQSGFGDDRGEPGEKRGGEGVEFPRFHAR